MPTRKRYRIFHDRPAQAPIRPAFRPVGKALPTKSDQEPDNKILSLVRGAIVEWLDITPAFKTSIWRDFVIVHDSISDDRLAIIEFKEDHLLINLPMQDDYITFLTLSIRGVQGGHQLNYSDPDLHAKVKRVIHSAYDNCSQPSAGRNTKKVSVSRSSS